MQVCSPRYMAYLREVGELLSLKVYMERRTSVSTPARLPRIEHDRSCTSAQCQAQGDHRDSGPLTSNKWIGGLYGIRKK